MVNFELSVYAFSILIVLYLALHTNKFEADLKLKILKRIIVTVGVMILLDVFLVLLDGGTQFYTTWVLLIGYTLYFMISPISSYLWLYYVLLFLFNDKLIISKVLKFGLVVLAMNALISLVNLYFPVYFSIDGNNLYQREMGMILNSVFSYVLIVLASLLVVINHKHIRRSDMIALLFFVVPPIFTNVYQLANEGSLVVWPGIVFSLIIAYIYVQNITTSKDYLSGLYNKKEFDLFLDDLISRKPKKGFVGLVIDIDDFKYINDTYGHDTGDKVIQQIGVLLNKSFRTNDFLARIGGDEFAVVARFHESHPSVFKQRIIKNVEKINQSNQFEFKISLSIGYAIWSKKENLDKETFFNKIDKNMYQQKNKQKDDSNETQ